MTAVSPVVSSHVVCCPGSCCHSSDAYV